MQEIVDRENKCTEEILELSITKEIKSWSEFYMFVKRYKGNKKNSSPIEDCNGGLVTGVVYKVNNLNKYYATVFSCKLNIPGINSTHSDKHFTINISKQLEATGRNKSGGTDAIPGAILKMGGEEINLYLKRLLDIKINNGIMTKDWKKKP